MLDELNVDRFAFAGLSVGGMWGAELALIAPERMKGLVLLDTSLAVEPAPSREHYFAMLDMVERAQDLPASLIDTIVPMFFSPDVERRAPGLAAGFRERLGSLDPLRLREGVVEIGRMTFGRRDTLELLCAHSIPILVMTGDADVPRPPQEGRYMATRLGCQFIEVLGAGHISALEQPGTVNTVLSHFLESIEGVQ